MTRGIPSLERCKELWPHMLNTFTRSRWTSRTCSKGRPWYCPGLDKGYGRSFKCNACQGLFWYVDIPRHSCCKKAADYEAFIGLLMYPALTISAWLVI